MNKRAKPKSIFLSYDIQDLDFVTELIKILNLKEIEVWDKHRDIGPGKRRDSIIEDVLNDAEIIVFVLSKSSVESKELQEEVAFAFNEHKNVVSILLEECEIPRRLKRIQFIDMSTDIKSGTEELLSTLALKGSNYSGLSPEIIEQLTESEKNILYKKEKAKKKQIQVRRKKRIVQFMQLFVATAVIVLIANYLSGLYKKDNMSYYDNFYPEFEDIIESGYPIQDVDQFMNLVSKHLAANKLCVHKVDFYSLFDREGISMEYGRDNRGEGAMDQLTFHGSSRQSYDNQKDRETILILQQQIDSLKEILRDKE